MNQPSITGRLALWPHQIDALAFCEPKTATMIAGGCGIGKSAIACHLLARWNARRCLIVCPPSVRSVHRRMIPLHCPIPMRAIILEKGSVCDRVEQADEALRDKSAACVVINTEAFHLEPLASWILSQRWDVIYLDESHILGLKTDGTRASTFASKLTNISGHRACLTGTPLAHSHLDSFAQYRFLDPKIFDMDYEAFRARYAAPKQIALRKKLRKSRDALALAVAGCFGNDSPLLDSFAETPDYSESLPGIKNRSEFLERIAPYTWTCKSSEVLDLPPLITDTREVELSPEQQKAYDELECELCWQDVSINSHLTLAIRLQQITSGFVGTDSGGIYRFKENPKRDALRDLLRAAAEPTIVFARYVADLDAIEATAKELGLRYAEISGRRKDAVTDLATLKPGIDVVGVQPKSGGTGIDLSAAKIGVWYSLAMSLAEYDQAVARLHRPGTTGVRLYSLICIDTVDSAIHESIADRRDVIMGIMNRLKRSSQ